MRMLHCTKIWNHLHLRREDQPEQTTMGFVTDLFSRPRPRLETRYREALAFLNALTPSDRADMGIKPSDFPRMAREMAQR
jgi:hypothetical protein